MTNHPNRKLTPKRLAFLEAAIANEGRVKRSRGTEYFGRAAYWRAGDVELTDANGQALVNMRLIERVSKPNGGTEMFGKGFFYRITDAGRAAVA